jgi:hypothetical protein
MRTPPALALLSLFVLGCLGPSVEIDRYRGLVATHFDGVPDRAEVCAIVTNRGDAPIDWVRLRLRSWSRLGEEPAAWTTHWVWRGRLAPAESAAIALPNPPVAEEIALDVRENGAGERVPRGRVASLAAECSEEALRRLAQSGGAGRTASGIELRAALRRGDAEAVVVAQSER